MVNNSLPDTIQLDSVGVKGYGSTSSDQNQKIHWNSGKQLNGNPKKNLDGIFGNYPSNALTTKVHTTVNGKTDEDTLSYTRCGAIAAG